MTTQHRQAVRSEYFYNRLSLDLPDMSLAILAVDAAEMRADIVREIEDQIIAEGGEIPSVPSDYRFSKEVLSGRKTIPNLPLARHLQDCRRADVTLAKSLARTVTLRHLVQPLHETYRAIWDFYQQKTGPIPAGAA